MEDVSIAAIVEAVVFVYAVELLIAAGISIPPIPLVELLIPLAGLLFSFAGLLFLVVFVVLLYDAVFVVLPFFHPELLTEALLEKSPAIYVNDDALAEDLSAEID